MPAANIKLAISNAHYYIQSLWVVSFGMALRLAIFQQTMESLLQGSSGVCVYLDKIQVSGSLDKKHLNHLDSLLCKFNASYFTFKEKKRMFMVPHVEYLDKEELHNRVPKFQLLKRRPSPKNKDYLNHTVFSRSIANSNLNNLKCQPFKR